VEAQLVWLVVVSYLLPNQLREWVWFPIRLCGPEVRDVFQVAAADLDFGLVELRVLYFAEVEAGLFGEDVALDDDFGPRVVE